MYFWRGCYICRFEKVLCGYEVVNFWFFFLDNVNNSLFLLLGGVCILVGRFGLGLVGVRWG